MAAAAALVTTALVAGQQAPVYRGRVDLVNLGVTITDKRGKLIENLTAQDFEILEDGKKQTVEYFASGTSPAAEMHLGLLLDVSESMSDDLAFTRTASIKFLNTLSEASDITLVDFDTEVRVARYEQREFARLIERIRGQKPRGETALFDAIGVYLDGAAAQSGRKIMLLYTDGGDTRSAMRFGELLDLAKASDVTVYAIGMLANQSMSAGSMQQSVLRQITEATGGQALFLPTVKELDKTYQQILAEIRAQYTLGYLSTNSKADGSWRKVEIKVTRADGRDLRVRSRKGYYATLGK